MKGSLNTVAQCVSTLNLICFFVNFSAGGTETPSENLLPCRTVGEVCVFVYMLCFPEE